MGLHRDGTVLGLSPLRAEERRRMWWQLQYMDLSVSRYVGALSTTIFANWDAHAPGNIEDADIGPDTKTMPPERTGLTEISPCLWCYHVLKINRSLKQPHSGGKSMAWALSPSVPLAEKDAMIDKIESDLRARYLQYCEPLNPLHVHVQLGIYQYLLAGRRVMRQPALVNAKISEMSRSKRDDFLAVCTKSLEYGNMAQTTETLNGFLWHNRGFFPWVARKSQYPHRCYSSNELCSRVCDSRVLSPLRRRQCYGPVDSHTFDLLGISGVEHRNSSAGHHICCAYHCSVVEEARGTHQDAACDRHGSSTIMDPQAVRQFRTFTTQCVFRGCQWTSLPGRKRFPWRRL